MSNHLHRKLYLSNVIYHKIHTCHSLQIGLFQWWNSRQVLRNHDVNIPTLSESRHLGLISTDIIVKDYARVWGWDPHSWLGGAFNLCILVPGWPVRLSHNQTLALASAPAPSFCPLHHPGICSTRAQYKICRIIHMRIIGLCLWVNWLGPHDLW